MNMLGFVDSEFLQTQSSMNFKIVCLCIFLLAVLHTLFANFFTKWSEKIAEKAPLQKIEKRRKISITFLSEILRFLGEVEVVFGLWVIPLLFTIIYFYSWPSAVDYLSKRVYIEPMLVVVIMSLTATKPILVLAENGLRFITKILGGSSAAWWLSILIAGPILGSFITEAGAMTLCALLLGKHFYVHEPSKKLAYGTLGLLFANISVGGLLTNFSAPPVLIVQRIWDWSSWFMFTHFGVKAIVGIICSTLCYFFFFRKELISIDKKNLTMSEEKEGDKIPFWVTAVHVTFLVWVILNSYYPPIFIGSFLMFLGFHQATLPHQFPVQLKRPLLVGLFLAGLLIHGGLQAWWIQSILGGLGNNEMMLISMALTAFNDNTAIAYLATLLPDLTTSLKYAVMSGVVVGGGLTVIANVPNPAGQVILKKFFQDKISPLYLLLAASIPTGIFYAIFAIFAEW
jgi:hypothetical protein